MLPARDATLTTLRRSLSRFSICETYLRIPSATERAERYGDSTSRLECGLDEFYRTADLLWRRLGEWDSAVVALFWSGLAGIRKTDIPRTVMLSGVDDSDESYVAVEGRLDEALLYSDQMIYPEFMWSAEGEWSFWFDKDRSYAIVGCSVALAEHITAVSELHAGPYQRQTDTELPIPDLPGPLMST